MRYINRLPLIAVMALSLLGAAACNVTTASDAEPVTFIQSDRS